MSSSTFRSAIDPTIGESPAHPPPTTLRQLINNEWLRTGEADLVVALRRHPVVLRDRSLLLDLAIEEYRSQRRAPISISLEQHCQRFRQFGSSIQRSILRQLEAQRYIDDHPELLEALCSPTWPKAGEDFGAFHVLEELGFGATAHVYLCQQQDVGNREVVVKATPFSSIEASILGRLNHPNIIPIYSTGLIDDFNLQYLCMPYCGRSTLTDVLDVAFQDGCPRRDDPIAAAATRWTLDEQWPAEKRRRRLSFGYRTFVDGVLALAIQIAEALDHAHHQGILHGDLKPSNVLLTPTSRPLLLDFNLSQDFAGGPAACGGTLPYMPPEHLQVVAGYATPQRPTSFDPGSDIYSFGALLYELLAGITPVDLPAHVGDASQVAAELLVQLDGGVPSIRPHNSLVSRRLETIVLQCLAFRRSDRPASISKIRQDLMCEMRSPAAIGRTARVRPFLFSAALGLPLAMLAGAGVHIANQPPQYLSDYQQGLKLASAGELEGAIDYFTTSAGANPSFLPARFQLARSHVARGDISAAISGFYELARDDRDVHSMAYLGYCFNLNRLPVAAIPWYERAMRNGAASAAIYNNLGASYIDAPPRLGPGEQLLLAEDCFHKALELDSASATIQLNIVRLAVAKSKADPSYTPSVVWRYAQAMLAKASGDRLVRFHVATWFDAVIKYEAAHDESERSNSTSFSTAEKSARNEFAALLENMEPLNKSADSADVARSWQSEKSVVPSVDRYILEPISLHLVQP